MTPVKENGKLYEQSRNARFGFSVYPGKDRCYQERFYAPERSIDPVGQENACPDYLFYCPDLFKDACLPQNPVNNVDKQTAYEEIQISFQRIFRNAGLR